MRLQRQSVMSTSIAVATDFTPQSERALAEGIAIARHFGADVQLIHVVGRLDGDDQSDAVKELDRAIRAEAKERIAKLHQKFDGQGATISQSLVEGELPGMLCAVASELGCQALVMATHGRTGLRHFFLGSIAEKVARNCPTDLLISRGTNRIAGYERILVPTDFSPSAERALARAIEFAAPSAEIDLIHVWQLPGPVTYQYAPLSSHRPALKRIASQLNSEAEKKALPVLEKYRRDDLAINFTALNGSPVPVILDRARGCDLIALGTHGHHGLKRLLLGSVAEKTIRLAPCSVLVARAAANLYGNRKETK